jgi:hypothetical protein
MATGLAVATSASHVSFDDGTLGCDGNHRRAWQWHCDNPADWSVVLEDDALPTGYDLRGNLGAMLHVAPSPIVSLYLGRLRPPHWQDRIAKAVKCANAFNAHWLVTDTLLHCVGVAVRGDLVTEMLTSLPEIPIDEAITKWAQRDGHKVSYCWPSLVNHRDTETLVVHRDNHGRASGRTAWRAGVRREWSGELVRL